jgi:hypothetical protein
MTHTDELILRTLVFQFDGRVVEIFGGPSLRGSAKRLAPLGRNPVTEAAGRMRRGPA